MAPYLAEKSGKFPPAPGQYKLLPEGVIFACPVCKGLSPIRHPTHKINEDGSVAPSVACPYNCGFHTHMTLKDWKA